MTWYLSRYYLDLVAVQEVNYDSHIVVLVFVSADYLSSHWGFGSLDRRGINVSNNKCD